MQTDMYEQKRKPFTQQQLNAALTSHERYLTYQGGMRAQLAHAALDGLNLANRNLTEADFSGASLVGASLSGSNLERASLYCADLRRCNLQSARLIRADLRGASFSGAKLSFALLDHADLRAAMMMYVGAGGVSVVNHEREKAKPGVAPAGVDFSNCSLKGASFGNAKLDNANFTGALLQGANFKQARLSNVNFRGAVLTGVDINELAVPPEAMTGCVRDVAPEAAAKFDDLKARLDAHQLWTVSGGAKGAPAVLDGEDLRPLLQLLVGRPLAGISARGAIAIGLDFSGSQFQAAKLDGADFRDANFSNADLRGTSFKNARLAHARFDKSNLCRLQLHGGTALAPNLCGTDAIELQFRTAILEDKVSALGVGQAPAMDGESSTPSTLP